MLSEKALNEIKMTKKINFNQFLSMKLIEVGGEGHDPFTSKRFE